MIDGRMAVALLEYENIYKSYKIESNESLIMVTCCCAAFHCVWIGIQEEKGKFH